MIMNQVQSEVVLKNTTDHDICDVIKIIMKLLNCEMDAAMNTLDGICQNKHATVFVGTEEEALEAKKFLDTFDLDTEIKEI